MTAVAEPAPGAAVIRTYRYVLQPNRVQRRALAGLLEGSRLVYNAALEEWASAWRWACRLASRLGQARFDRKAVAAMDPEALSSEQVALRDTLLSVRLPDYYTQTDALSLKAQRASIGEVVHKAPNVVTRWALSRLDDARRAFFDRCRAGRTPGYPRFRSRSRWSTLGFSELRDVAFRRPEPSRRGARALGVVQLPGVPGLVRVRTHRPLPDGAVVKAATATLRNGRWSISLAVRFAGPDVEPADALGGLADRDVLGVDWGVSHLATLDDGTTLENVRHADRLRARVRRAARALARARRGSTGRREKVRRLAALRRREADGRKTALRQAAAALVAHAAKRGARAIALEALQVGNMTRSARSSMEQPGRQVRQKAGLNRAILDAAPAAFSLFVQVKAASAGLRTMLVDPRRTSILCSGCRADVPKTLRERVHACPSCGVVLDRDRNAALNIARRGAEALRALARGG